MMLGTVEALMVVSCPLVWSPESGLERCPIPYCNHIGIPPNIPDQIKNHISH